MTKEEVTRQATLNVFRTFAVEYHGYTDDKQIMEYALEHEDTAAFKIIQSILEKHATDMDIYRTAADDLLLNY